ncbi:hypothetical protein DN062_10185 [Nitrincola tibetensis]|uniref:Uncharacterized protein n=1 Tax=Nitrincola tibetensis TaxID=2219697 RepID=A0A364NLZ7_9GAMM|nr:hypothetical protein DN062_10185 [Nitrincola tibetensis]
MSYFKFSSIFYIILLITIVFMASKSSLDPIEKIAFIGITFSLGCIPIARFFYTNKKNIESYSRKPTKKNIFKIFFGDLK